MAESIFTPTLKMAANAKRGFKLRAKFGRGCTQVGVRRAHQLAERFAVHEKDIQSMASYLARHKIDKKGKAHSWDINDDPSAGVIAWLLWGGDEGRKWAEAKQKSLDS